MLTPSAIFLSVLSISAVLRVRASSPHTVSVHIRRRQSARGGVLCSFRAVIVNYTALSRALPSYVRALPARKVLLEVVVVGMGWAIGTLQFCSLRRPPAKGMAAGKVFVIGARRSAVP